MKQPWHLEFTLLEAKSIAKYMLSERGLQLLMLIGWKKWLNFVHALLGCLSSSVGPLPISLNSVVKDISRIVSSKHCLGSLLVSLPSCFRE
jgi:hypothetical protein